MLPQEKYLAVFYEDIFERDGLNRICAFLGLDFVPTDLSVKHHEGKSLKMTKTQESAAFAALKPQYDAAQKAFVTLPRKWQDRIDTHTK